MRPESPGGKWYTVLAAHRRWGCVIAAAVPVLLRLALLSVAPPPEPYCHDEFSYLLGADTFAHGRLTNPPHPMWVHLEAFHVNPIPTYASKYPPAQALILAAGQVAFGHPWAGVLLGYAFMCAAICWALQQWGPPWAALLVSILAGLQLGFGFAVDSISAHWLSTYWGGAVACAGGALVIGSLPGLVRRISCGALLTVSVGALVLANSRPFEGMLLVLIFAFALAIWRWGTWRQVRLQTQPSVIWPAALVLLCGGAWMAYYNYRVTGDPMLFPYIVNQRLYAMASGFWLSPELPQVNYRHEEIRRLYMDWDLQIYRAVRSNPWIMVKQALIFAIPFLFSQYWIPSLLVLFVMRPNRKFRFTVALLAGFTILAIAPMKFVLTHYLAPAIPLVLIGVMQGFRLLRCATRRQSEIWRFAFRGWVAVSLLAAFGDAAAWGVYDAKPHLFTRSRLDVSARLKAAGGQHLVIVRRSSDADIHNDWINNAADVDRSPVVWARDMGPALNPELLAYFAQRKKWLLMPDELPVRLVRYPE